jgi:hypothetical protein
LDLEEFSVLVMREQIADQHLDPFLFTSTPDGASGGGSEQVEASEA